MAPRTRIVSEQSSFVPFLSPTKQGRYEIHNVDTFDWLDHASPSSIHAVVTDPLMG